MSPADNVSMTDTRKRQPKGVPVGGQFAEGAHDEAANSLGEDTIPAEPIAEDFDWARRSISSRYSSSSAFHESEHSEQIAVLAERRALFQAPLRAFRAGVPHPLDAVFDEMWDQTQPGGKGFSREDAESSLTYIESQRALPQDQRFESDRTLDSQEEFWREAIDTRGRSLGVNQSIAFQPAENAVTPR